MLDIGVFRVAITRTDIPALNLAQPIAIDFIEEKLAGIA